MLPLLIPLFIPSGGRRRTWPRQGPQLNHVLLVDMVWSFAFLEPLGSPSSGLWLSNRKWTFLLFGFSILTEAVTTMAMATEACN